MTGVLSSMVKFSNHTSGWATVLSVMNSIQVRDPESLKHIQVKIDEWMPNAEKLKNHSSAGSLLIVLSNL